MFVTNVCLIKNKELIYATKINVNFAGGDIICCYFLFCITVQFLL